MVVAPDDRSRDRAAAILHTHGAEFVGFYGRWAYQSIPGGAATPAAQQHQAYDIALDGATSRVRFEEGVATTLDSPGPPGVVTAIGPGLFLVSWPVGAGTATVHVVDVDAAIVYASFSTPDGSPPRHVKGTISPVR